MTEPIIVTGTGAVTPLGVGAATLHERWASGACGIEDGLGACQEFVASDWLSKREIRRTPRFSQLAIAAASEALADAGWDGGMPYDAARVGCVMGTGYGPMTTLEESWDVMRKRGMNAVNPFMIVTSTANAAAVALQLRHGIKGESYGLVAACAAGAQAIGAGIRMLQNGTADAVLVGGAESGLSDRVRASLEILGALSASGTSRPFDRRRDGFVLGEGAGVLVLETAAAARARGATERARIVGYGSSSDAYHVTAPPEDGRGSVAAVEAALESASVAPADVQYVNAHGTATILNDRTETIAIKRVFGEHASRLQVSSTKSAVGHLIGAAGAVEAIATIYALRTKTVAPTLGLEEPEEGLDLDYVPLRQQPLRPPAPGRRPVAISNCFGFGGHNAVLVIEPPPGTDEP